MKRITVFDSTLRDGAQGEGINYSAEDKFRIMKSLDKFGIDFIEAGNPASNQKDFDFFLRASKYEFKHAKLVAFGSTCRHDISPKDDRNVQTLLSAGTEYIAVFGKSWDMQVTDVLRTSLEENIRMIYATVEYLVSEGKKVFFDAEHFFDGYKNSPEYALESIRAAEKAGATMVVLCDTNGGCFPDEIFEITKAAAGAVKIPVGIHCHNDTGCAAANSIFAVKAGAEQVQGTFIGIGERCGNANLSTVLPSLVLKLGYDCGSEIDLKNLTKTARLIAEISNIVLPATKPYVGRGAFAHKAGMHADGVQKNSKSFEHIQPDMVGNVRSFLLSEIAGRTVVHSKLSEIAPELTRDCKEVGEIMELLKEMEYKGYQYEAAIPSFEMMVLRHLGKLQKFFSIDYFKIIGEKADDKMNPCSAIVKVRVGEKTKIAADEGEGPINAIDKALRQALGAFYPELSKVHLTDYKVRVVDSKSATAAVVRVLIESSDGENSWTTVGASTDIINASVTALADSIDYKLYSLSRA
ncbi:MAG: citramalate synthase [Oscillospiraceae bacterium]